MAHRTPAAGRTVRNPYEGVDWEAVGRHKANFHAHTDQSDGRLSPADLVDAYKGRGYSVLSITDHDSRHSLQKFVRNIHHPARCQADPQAPDKGNPRIAFPPGCDRGDPDWQSVVFLQEDLQAMANSTWPLTPWERRPGEFAPDKATGLLPNGMLLFQGNELSNHRHIVSLFSDFGTTKWKPGRAEGLPGAELGTEEESLLAVGERGGMAILAHPAAEPEHYEFVESLFRRHSCLVGMEVSQPWQRNAAPLWDHLLSCFMPERPVWGFGADDFHSEVHFEFGWNVLLLDELTHGTARRALEQGRFFFSRASDVWYRNTTDPNLPPRNPEFGAIRGTPPAIHSISVDQDAGAIEIRASGHDEIVWISNGQEIHKGPALNCNQTPGIGNYVRAELRRTEMGESREIKSFTYTNPFGVGGAGQLKS